MRSYSDNAREYKRKRSLDLNERKKHKQSIPSRKTLLDRLDSARKTLLWYMERNEDPRLRNTFWVSGLDWAGKKYLEALIACRNAGIDVKS